MSWQPLQMPSENVSGRFLKASNSDFSSGLKLIFAAQPVAEPSVSANENPPTKMTPRNRSRLTRFSVRSVIVTSHGSKPTASSTHAISRSPFDPCSRSTATGILPHSASVSNLANASGKLPGNENFGPDLVSSPSRSCSMHSSSACCFSSSKDVASQVSRSCRMEVGPRNSSWLALLMATKSSASVRPMLTAPKASITVDASSSATSRSSPGASEKRNGTASIFDAFTVTSAPRFPPKHISSSATIRPPSETSCTARHFSKISSVCSVSNTFFSRTKSTSATPQLSKFRTWLRAVPATDQRGANFDAAARFPPTSTHKIRLPAHLNSGVIFRRTSGTFA
mmetsp:Transcript_11209/g.27411  ORF Transcript_11209/g.27411 Transcript_11209/m.27411 type:complete len:339 (+) Transcript_11209:367-1383(+)